MRNMVQSSKVFFKKNGATILTCVGAVGVVTTSVMTGKAAIKAQRALDQTEMEKGDILTPAEKIKVAGPIYIPPVLVGVATIACVFGANIINKRVQASLMSSYMLLDRTFKEYREKTNDIYGEDANEKINEAMKEDNKTESEEELFFDDYSQRFFRVSKNKVQQAEYNLNRNLIMRDYAYLNEWYEDLGLELVDPDYKLGWSTWSNFELYWQSWIDFSHSKRVKEDGTEYTVIYMMEEPIENFEDY